MPPRSFQETSISASAPRRRPPSVRDGRYSHWRRLVSSTCAGSPIAHAPSPHRIAGEVGAWPGRPVFPSGGGRRHARASEPGTGPGRAATSAMAPRRRGNEAFVSGKVQQPSERPSSAVPVLPRAREGMSHHITQLKQERVLRRGSRERRISPSPSLAVVHPDALGGEGGRSWTSIPLGTKPAEGINEAERSGPPGRRRQTSGSLRNA